MAIGLRRGLLFQAGPLTDAAGHLLRLAGRVNVPARRLQLRQPALQSRVGGNTDGQRLKLVRRKLAQAVPLQAQVGDDGRLRLPWYS